MTTTTCITHINNGYLYTFLHPKHIFTLHRDIVESAYTKPILKRSLHVLQFPAYLRYRSLIVTI
nr:MAG TPA: hypothetical protein [Caudoviricetes sp.]